jgi:predicted DNA-binding transcriptional regulator YafY
MNDVATEFTIAIQQEEVVQFLYDHHQLRTFSPWEIQEQYDLVLGWDHDRAAVRSFNFNRVASDVASYPNDEYVRPT